MSANDRQVGGEHYRKSGALQHWDFVAHFGLDYFQGQITKYVLRWRDKGGLVDLEKARHFLDKYIELERARAGEVDAPRPRGGTGGMDDLAGDEDRYGPYLHDLHEPGDRSGS